MDDDSAHSDGLDEDHEAGWPPDLVEAVAVAREAVSQLDEMITGVLVQSAAAEAGIWLERWRYHRDRIEAELQSINPLMANPTVAASMQGQATRLRTQLERPKATPESNYQQVLSLPANLLNLTCILTGRRAPSRESDHAAAGVTVGRLTSRLAELEAKTGQAARQLKGLEHQASQERERLSSFLIELQESGQRRLDEEAKRFRDSGEDVLAQQRKQGETWASDSAAQFEELVEHREKADELMGIIAGSTVASGYSQVALEARKAARIWEGLGVAALVGFIVVGVWLGSTVIADGATVPMIVARVLAAGGPLFVALYFFRRANSMRRWQRVNRQSALGLAALEPYLKDFAPETRDEIRKRLVDRFFQLTPDNPDEGSGGVDAKTFKEVMEPVTELVKATRGGK